MSPFAYAEVANVIDAVPKARVEPWSNFVARFIKPAVRRGKAGRAFIAATFSEPNRRNDAVQCVTAAVFDLDSGNLTRADIEKRLKGYRLLAHTTYSSTKKARRWRIVIPYSEPATLEQHAETYGRIAAKFGDAVDRSGRSPSHLFFFPAVRSGTEKDYVVFECNGELLDPKQRHITLDFSAPVIDNGERNTTLASLAGSMRRRGMSRKAIEAALVTENAQSCHPPLPRSEVIAIASSVARYQPDNEKAVRLMAMNTMQPELTGWAWREYIARGVVNLLPGEGGTGKSQIAIAIAAVVSRGGHFPDGTRAERGNVVILTAEDHPTRVALPRLIAAGADTTRVFYLEGTLDSRSKHTRMFSFEHDTRSLEAKVREVGDVRMVIIDPVSAYMGFKVDSHQTSHVRSWLMPIAEFAEATDCAVLLIAHFNKSGDSRRSAVDRISGSAAWAQAARRVLYVVRDDADQLYFLRGKTNLSKHSSGGFKFSIESALVAGNIETSRVVWGDATDARADDVLEGAAKPLDMAKNWLAKRLAQGPVSASLLEEECPEEFSWRTVKTAKGALRIVSRKRGAEGWQWTLPKKDK